MCSGRLMEKLHAGSADPLAFLTTFAGSTRLGPAASGCSALATASGVGVLFEYFQHRAVFAFLPEGRLVQSTELICKRIRLVGRTSQVVM